MWPACTHHTDCMIQCQHLITALNACAAREYYIRPHVFGFGAKCQDSLPDHHSAVQSFKVLRHFEKCQFKFSWNSAWRKNIAQWSSNQLNAMGWTTDFWKNNVIYVTNIQFSKLSFFFATFIPSEILTCLKYCCAMLKLFFCCNIGIVGQK